MKCGECGSKLGEGTQVCGACGTAVTRNCPACKSDSPVAFRFCGSCGLRFDDAAHSERTPTSIMAERRVVSVMFTDLVGSTALSTQVDPEDLRDILQAYRQACAQVIRAMGGHLAKLIGDGLLVLFGYPTAHEDAAERAVWAGLKVVEAVRDLHHPKAPDLRVRVGIATGLVVVGRLEAEGAAEEDSVVGETPNLAARIQSEAEPGEVLLSDDTRQLIGDLFELTDLGTRSFKGISHPTRVFRAVGRHEPESRFEAVRATRARAPAPLVGRETELGSLIEKWRAAAAGAGQSVLVVGEAGIGKSRLVKGLSETLDPEPHVRVRLQCSPFHVSSPLHPVQLYLARTAGFSETDSAEVKRSRLEALLAPAEPESLSLIAAMMSIPPGDDYPRLDLPPAKRKEKTLDLIATRILAQSQKAPLLVTVEDAHWIDPTTLELLRLLLERVPSLPAFVLVTGRPEVKTLWKQGPLPEVLALDRLKKASCEKLVRELLLSIGPRAAAGSTAPAGPPSSARPLATPDPGSAELPEDVIQGIVERTDGMPLYIEVLTETVVESGVDGKIPSSLHDSLMARLDRLGVGKETAQIAACIGRSFSRDLLAAADPDLDIRRGLHILEQAGLILPIGTPESPLYVFKHALLRDTAYESLLKKRRENVHASIARALEDAFPEQAATEPEIVAQHYTLARIPGPAVEYWHSAGRRSSERSANAEAITHLQTALDQLKTLPGTTERDRRELRLCIDIAGPLIATRGYAAPELDQVVSRALQLCRRIEVTAEVFPVLYGRWVFHTVTGRMRRSLELAEECVSLADLQGGSDPKMVALRMLGTSHCILGQQEMARKHLEEALASYDPERHRKLMFAFGQDIRVSALCYLALGLVQGGELEAALSRADEAVTAARALGHANTLGYALMHVALVKALGGDVAAVSDCARELVVLATQNEMRLWAATGRFFEGWAMSQREAESGIGRMGDAAAGIAAAGVKLFRPIFLGWKAEACLRAHRAEEARQALAEARAVMEETGERWLAPALDGFDRAASEHRPA